MGYQESQFRHNIHYIISIYLVFGGIITNNIILLYIHFLITLFTILHWFLNNGKCFLTEMDYNTDEEPNAYTKHVLDIFKIPYNDLILDIMGYASVVVPCLYSLYKIILFTYYKNAISNL